MMATVSDVEELTRVIELTAQIAVEYASDRDPMPIIAARDVEMMRMSDLGIRLFDLWIRSRDWPS